MPARPSQPRWRPIRSAPKDGTHILLCYPSFGDDTDPPIVGQGKWVQVVHTNIWLEARSKGEVTPHEGVTTEGHWEAAYVATLMHGGGGGVGHSWEARSVHVDPTHWMPLPHPAKARS